MGRSKTNLSKWGYADTADTACECGTSEQTMQHLLSCPLLENECSLEDLATANEKALHCARAWPNIWLNSEMMDTKEELPWTWREEYKNGLHRRAIQSYIQSCHDLLKQWPSIITMNYWNISLSVDIWSYTRLRKLNLRNFDLQEFAIDLHEMKRAQGQTDHFIECYL